MSVRVGQLISGFCSLGHEVSVIHRDQLGEVVGGYFETKKWNYAGGIVERTVIKEKDSINRIFTQNPILRFIKTYYQLLYLGDWSGIWAIQSFERLKNVIDPPHIILSFFTPRGPLFLGKLLGDYWNVPYVFDFQDEWDQGLRNDQRFLARFWMKRVVKKARHLVHVSPEWAKRDSKQLDKAFMTLRHAVPESKSATHKMGSDKFVMLYVGSIDRDNQDIESFLSAITRFSNKKNIIFQYAGHQSTSEHLKGIIKGIEYEYLGWLDQDTLDHYVSNSTTLLLFGWRSATRVVVPSKLYYYMSFDKPILIVGKDSGSLMKLLHDWHHSKCIHEDADRIEEVILEGTNSDYTNYLIPGNCKNVMKAKDLVKEYSLIIEKL